MSTIIAQLVQHKIFEKKDIKMLKHKLGERRAKQKIQNVCPKLTCISFGPCRRGGRGYTKGTGPFIQRQRHKYRYNEMHHQLGELGRLIDID